MKVMEKIKKFFMWIVMTNLGRIIFSFLLGSLFLGLFNYYFNNIFIILSLIFFAILAGHVLVFFAFAWVINPVRDKCNYYNHKYRGDKMKDSKFCRAFFKKQYK